ncbi:ComF family protein, partial [Candidatus Saccharibacteria bacterium]|nr:ComF family protein [Candidatus Saccharibacteria bacterium]
TGGFLCERCKKDISENILVREIGERGEFLRAEYLGFRDEILGEMVEECKYAPARGLTAEIAEVVWRGYFEKRNSPLILVPMPTSRKHVRGRGFDHVDLVCREIVRLSGGAARRVRLLARAKDTVQVGATEEVRRKQAKEAVRVDGKEMEKFLESGFKGEVVLIDDVWTTGASMLAAGRILKEAGVTNLVALAVTKNRPRKRPVIRHGEID